MDDVEEVMRLFEGQNFPIAQLLMNAIGNATKLFSSAQQ